MVLSSPAANAANTFRIALCTWMEEHTFMDAIFIPGRDVAATLKRLIKTHSKFYWAVAWGSDNPALPELLNHQSKIARLVIGTHFYQTPPAFLEQFENVKAARVVLPEGATFHPKTYLFVSRERSVALIGSANFTQSAMKSNIESCCSIEGRSDEEIFRNIQQFIEDDCWKKAQVIDDNFLRAYRIQHAATKAARAALKRFVPLKRPKVSAQRGDPLEMDWPGFIARVNEDRYHSIEERLELLTRARAMLSGVEKFSMLPDKKRKAIAGTLGKVEMKSSPGELDWGYFGAMGGFGVFQTLINGNSADISDALDCIPLNGPVKEVEYDLFVKHFLKAFKAQSRVGGVASASRLLAMKRPDYFVCIDRANKKGLSEHFGMSASAVTLENYWSDLIEPITLSSWWRAPRPRGAEGNLWDARAAFLDAIFYEPT